MSLLQIRSLEVTSCAFDKIHPNAFDSLAGTLEELWLINASLTAVPKFAKLKKLKSLNLNRNLLKDFPEYALIGLKELKQVRLRGNQICTLGFVFFVYDSKKLEKKSNKTFLKISNN